ncbi:MAG: IS982 family transposase [Bacteroidales bacterium]|nr:IS982 family transposase [Bacteroidales bacterium]
MKKLHISLIFSNLVVFFKDITNTAIMHNFIAKFEKIHDILKKFAWGLVNEFGNVPRRGVVPKFSDLEIIALSVTAEAFGMDSENYLFKRLEAEKGELLPNLVTRRQYNQRRKITYRLGEEIRRRIASAIDGGEDVFCIDSKPVKVCQNSRAKRCTIGRDDIEHAPAWGYCASQGMFYYGYKLHAVSGIRGVIHSYDLTAANVHDIQYTKDIRWEFHDCTVLGDKGYLCASVQLDLFETANITLEVPYRLNQKNWVPTSWAYRRFRKRIETVFSQLNDQFMMIRNYAKKTLGIFTRIAAKIAAMTTLQYVNYLNHHEIGQVKYSLI